MAGIDNDLEEVMGHLGEFGKYQLFQFLLHIVGALTAGLHMLTLLTVAAVPETYICAPPGTNLNETVITNETFLLTPELDKCSYKDSYNQTMECDQWIYDRTYYESSIGMDWNFVCTRRWMGATAQSAYMFGVFLGAVTLGSMADNYGRKIIFYVSSVAQLILGVSVAFIPEYYSFVLVRFLYGYFGSAGAYITGFVLSMELVGASKRTFCGLMFQLAFAVGFMLVAGWGAIIKNATYLQVVYGMHSALLLGHWWLMDESPRWLWAQGRIRESLAIVQKALRMNGSTVILDVEKYTSKGKIKEINDDEKAHSGFDLLRTPNLRNKTLNVCFNWFANSIVYYGLSLNTKSLPGNPYLMMFLSGLVEVPSYIFVCLVMDRWGRRSLISGLMLIGGVCCVFASAFSEEDSFILKITVSLIGKACIAGSFAIIYNYTAELFPTVLRNTALGVGSMCARLSGAITPLLMLLDFLDPKVPATVFGIIALGSGFTALWLPETLNKPMPETLEDGEEFGKGDTCFSSCCNQRVVDKRSYQVALEKMGGNAFESGDSKA
ncbi:unnamed protein product [Trichogramma brassicae]|uniref:Major facilitator superfamily (MFS) profile domain-containing protein n=1 Tax=Trichogramma brassicae TaxID=86971 RepID=A0A6H5IGV5_9HYME|nr:unnamed protein product [Trichogramma brassicae]